MSQMVRFAVPFSTDITLAGISLLKHIVCTGSSVDITTGYGLDNRCSILGRSKSFFSVPQRPALRPASLLSHRNLGIFSPGVMSQGAKLTIFPSTAEVKKGGATPPITHIFMARCLIK
jgi:hypothetical protein